MSANAQPTEYTVDQKSFEESFKLRYDFYKHLTTLNTGSILILVTFLEKIFTNPKWKILVGLSFCLFLISIIASMISMLWTTSVIRERRIDAGGVKFVNAVIIICLLTFLSGIICLIIFAIVNLYT